MNIITTNAMTTGTIVFITLVVSLVFMYTVERITETIRMKYRKEKETDKDAL